MKKWIAALVVSLGLTGVAKAELTAREAAEILNDAVVEYSPQLRSPHCTAFAIGEGVYMTAGHCILRGKSYVQRDWLNISVQAITFGVGTKDSNDRNKDWAILHTGKNLKDTVPLTLACEEELYIGMPIAYMGYPHPLQRFFNVGVLGSLDGSRSVNNDSDIITDLSAAPGASGSPVISMDTGHVIGILTEGYFARVGVVGVGIEGLASDNCSLGNMTYDMPVGTGAGGVDGADRPDVNPRVSY